MALLLKNNAVFLHIPKTGGNWVTDVLRNEGLVVDELGMHKHIDMQRLLNYGDYHPTPSWLSPIAKKIHAKRTKLNPDYIFCFVRNPFHWYESWWQYMSQPKRDWRDYGEAGNPHKWHPNAPLNGLGGSSFNAFVKNVIQKHPGYVTELYSWYTEPPINFIGKQESLCNDLIHALKTLNLDFDEDRIRNQKPVGVSPKTQPVQWHSETRQQIATLEKEAFQKYGYTNRQRRSRPPLTSASAYPR